MRKVCVFVEGQTEQIFVREFLLKWFEYQSISIECLQLIGTSVFGADYDYPNPNATIHYQIVNVGNDNRVLSWLLDRVNGLLEEGFDLVIGLRDMYSQKYRQKSNVISEDVNTQFINAAQDVIASRLNEKADFVSFHFAIMEIETWMLAMYPSLLKKFRSLTKDDLQHLYDLQSDMEKTIYHPADTLDQVFQLAGENYEKHRSDANSILSYMDKDDFVGLLNSGKTATFRQFVNALVAIPESPISNNQSPISYE